MSEQPAERTADFELVPPEDLGDTPAIYSNFVQATASPLDLTFHLGWYAIPALVTPPTERVRVPVRSLLKVSVPINLVPGIIGVLQAQMNAWQQIVQNQEETDRVGAPE